MSTTSSPPEIILYHYPFSPYARKVIWYLNLRRIPYTQCLQPLTMPRPILASLGVSYRRIPVLSINKDIYCDTRLILSKLDTLIPPSSSHPSLSNTNTSSTSSTTTNTPILERLFETWASDGGLFGAAAALIPTSAPVLNDANFVRDREDFTGRSWSREAVEKARPAALVEVRRACGILEELVLGDGRMWIAGGGSEGGPGRVDIEAIWPFHWLTTLPNALPPTLISATQFPKLFAYISRFDSAVRSASKAAGPPHSLKGSPEVLDLFAKMGCYNPVEPEMAVWQQEPSGLKKGDGVEIGPADYGFSGKDRGALLRLDVEEVVIAGKTERDDEVRIHVPRHGFRVRKVGGGGAKL